MAEPLRPLIPLLEADEDSVSTVSPSSSRRSHVSPIKEFSPGTNFRRGEYQRMSEGYDSEMADLADGLGIMQQQALYSRPVRVPVGSKVSPPDTPRSHHGLMCGQSPPFTEFPSPKSIGDVQGSSPWNERSTVVDCVDDVSLQESDVAKGLGTPGSMCSVPDTPRFMDDIDEGFDDELFYEGFGDIHAKRTSWLSITVYVLSIYSTVMSGIWLVVAIYQPRWGSQISSKGGLGPSTATTVAALIAKSIEMAFVTVFISWLGQVLTRRAIVRNTHGITLGEMTMRNWVIQPGSLITHGESFRHAGLTLLGALTLTATIAATFYTTASDAMVAPKLKYGDWEHKELSGHVLTSYANAQYVGKTCPSLTEDVDTVHASQACLAVQFSGQSYRNLMNFMTTWNVINENGTGVMGTLDQRPVGTTLLFDNTTMTSSWIKTATANATAKFEEHGRIINNVSLAMPHPGVYAAATTKENRILQPDDLAGVGEYSIRAGVVSPSINVMCVNMNADELTPLVYTQWPHAKNESTFVGEQMKGWSGWQGEVPDKNTDTTLLNRTVVDDIFRWGPEYGRRPPVFQLYPADNQLLTNSTVHMSDSIYMMGKKEGFENYTLCELKSWLHADCSTQFDISGISGAKLSSRCEDSNDKNNYLRSLPPGAALSGPVSDWKWLADSWQTSMDLNGGSYNNNASNARIITQLALDNPKLPGSLPSMAEALAVFASSTLVLGAIDTTFRHYWDWPAPALGAPGPMEHFNASVRTQEYTSGHVNDWQSVFYVVLVLVFAINLFCLIYFTLRSGLVTDFTEPQNLFALAVNSPPSAQVKGSCGGGPGRLDLEVPWRIAMARKTNHYFFSEAQGRPSRRKVSREDTKMDREAKMAKGASYKRLSLTKSWL